MKAVQILGEASSPNITTTTAIPVPVPKGSEILIRVHAAGITGDELTWPELYATPTRIPGHDISGTVHSLGPSYTGSLSIRQAVFALITADRGEGQAEFVICTEEEVASKPETITHAEAAALPIPLLTAWEALVDHGKIGKGMRVLVTGASGAVGFCFLQLAVIMFDAEVIALASVRNHKKLKDSGAKTTLDYHEENWYQEVRNVDMVFDTVGGDILGTCWETVGEKGVVVTVADPPPPWAFGRCKADEEVRHPLVRYLHFIVSPGKARLEEASKLVDNGAVKPLAVKPFPFKQAVEAWGYAQKRNRGQKVVIEFLSGDDL